MSDVIVLNGDHHEQWDMVSVILEPDDKGVTQNIEILGNYLRNGFEPFSVQSWMEPVAPTKGIMTTTQMPKVKLVKEYHLKKKILVKTEPRRPAGQGPAKS